jgi:hypothetical protein
MRTGHLGKTAFQFAIQNFTGYPTTSQSRTKHLLCEDDLGSDCDCEFNPSGTGLQNCTGDAVIRADVFDPPDSAAFFRCGLESGSGDGLVGNNLLYTGESTEELYAINEFYRYYNGAKILSCRIPTSGSLPLDTYSDDTYNNSTSGSAVTITGGVFGPLIASTPEDWYKFYHSGNGISTVRLTFEHVGGDLNLALYDSSLNLVRHGTSSTDNE